MSTKWIEIVERIRRLDLTEYFPNVSENDFDELMLYIEAKRYKVKVSYNRLLKLTISSPHSQVHGCVAGSCSGLNVTYNLGLGRSSMTPVISLLDTNVQFNGGSRFSGMPNFQFRVAKRDSSNVVGLVNFKSRRVIDIPMFIQEGLDYIRYTDNVLSVVLIWIDEHDMHNGRFGLLLLEIRRISPIISAASKVPDIDYVFNPMISFGAGPLHTDVINAFIDNTTNTTEVVAAVAAAAAPEASPVPLVTNVINGVGFGGPACNALNIPEYQYILPGNLVLALDNFGDIIYNDINNPPDFVIDLFDINDILH